MSNDSNFDSLFTPFSIGKMEIKNRLVMSPMGTYAALMDGSVSDTLATYFEERAKGGVGAIITASQYLTPKLAQGIYGTYFDSKRIIPHLTGMTERIHCYGAKAIAQLSSGTGRNAHPSQCGGVPFSASAVPAVFNPKILCRPLTIEEIKEIMKSWQLAAEIAANAGYDAIEVHGHVGYIIDQFLTPLWNKREDEYGGSDENRARFALEILQAIKRGAGNDMPVIYRISMDHRIPGGRTLEDSKRLIKILGENGVDAFDVDCGCYEHPDFVYPTFYRGDACMEYVCDTAREATDKPILNSGNHTPQTAKHLIESGRADFAMMGRPLIADPYLPRKLMENREEDVRPCIRCNEECIGRIWGRYSKLSCAVNPQANEEHAFRIVKTETPKNVVVIGGGPGGMEAARVAALKGNHVTLYERNELGGTLNLPAQAQFKTRLKALIEYHFLRLGQQGLIRSAGRAVRSCRHRGKMRKRHCLHHRGQFRRQLPTAPISGGILRNFRLRYSRIDKKKHEKPYIMAFVHFSWRERNPTKRNKTRAVQQHRPLSRFNSKLSHKFHSDQYIHPRLSTELLMHIL